MNKLQLACYSLTASAFVLAGLLVVALQNHLPQAHAGLVTQKDDYAFLTATTRSGEDSLFILDSRNQRLMVYTLDVGKKRIDLARTEDLNQIFTRAFGK